MTHCACTDSSLLSRVPNNESADNIHSQRCSIASTLISAHDCIQTCKSQTHNFHAIVVRHKSVAIADRINRVIKPLLIVSRIFFKRSNLPCP